MLHLAHRVARQRIDEHIVARHLERRLAREGVLITAKVVNASSVRGVRVVAIRYTLNGRTKRRKFDLYGLWAEKLDAPEELEILATPGFYGMVHILGRKRVHDLHHALQRPDITPRAAAAPTSP